MSDPGGGPGGHPNMRPGMQQGYPQTQQPPPQMMRPQVQHYINRPSPSYQGQPAPQFPRYPQPMQGMQQQQQPMPGPPHQMNMGPRPGSQLINQHTTAPQFGNVNQGSPMNLQQATGSPYPLHGSPVVGQRYNSPQMQQPSHQQQQVPMQAQQMPPQQQRYPQQMPMHQQPQMQQRYPQQMQQHQPGMSPKPQQPPGSQQAPSPYSQPRSLQQPGSLQQAASPYQQQQKSLQQPSSQQQVASPYSQPKSLQQPGSLPQAPSPYQQSLQKPGSQQQAPSPYQQQQRQSSMSQYPPNTPGQPYSSQQGYQQQVASPQLYSGSQQGRQDQQQYSNYPPPSQEPIPFPEEQPMEDPGVQFAVPAPPQGDPNFLAVPSQAPKSSRSPRHIAPEKEKQIPFGLEVPEVRKPRKRRYQSCFDPLKDPKKNLLMAPKASIMKVAHNDGVPKSVQFSAEAEPETKLSPKKPLRSRLVAPISPPLYIMGKEAEIAENLMKPIYSGELVLQKSDGKHTPGVRARLVGGKIVKPNAPYISRSLDDTRRPRISQNAYRQRVMELSFDHQRAIEAGEAPQSTEPLETVKKSAIIPLKEVPEPSCQTIPYQRAFFHVDFCPTSPKKESKVQPEITPEEQEERLRTRTILNNIPWRTIPRQSKVRVIPRIWHPPIQINPGWIVIPKSHYLCRSVPVWHPPLRWPPRNQHVVRKVFKVDGKWDVLRPKNPLLDSGMEVDENFGPKSNVVRFGSPAVLEDIEEIDVAKATKNLEVPPGKSAMASKSYEDPMETESRAETAVVDEEDDAKPPKERKPRASSPSLVRCRYIKPSSHVPSLLSPPPPTEVPPELKPPIDLDLNPLYGQQQGIPLNEDAFVNLRSEYRVSQIRLMQPKNMWEINNQKMIDLMKTKGAGIDSAVREDAGKALKILEERASSIMGKHAEIRHTLLRFCLTYGFEYADFPEDGVFYIQYGDFDIHLTLQDYYVTDVWYFWDNVDPIHAPSLLPLFQKEKWDDIYRVVTRMRNIIPILLTSEEKDLVLRALSCLERDLQRYYESVEWRSHLFALNNMIPRTDVHPFAIIMPKPYEEKPQGLKEVKSDLAAFEECDNAATLQVQFSPLQRHRFSLQTSLTPSNKWTSPDGYKVVARFVVKFEKPIPIRYGAMKQLKKVTSGVIVQENYTNAYKHLSHEKYKRDVLLNLSNYSSAFFMLFNFDKFDEESKNDSVITGFYIEKAPEFISAMYVIKREYILNKLCESTCDEDPHMIEFHQRKKIPLNIRLAEVGNGHMTFYFRYRCYLVEATLTISAAGHVIIGNLRIVHHGNFIDFTYQTVSSYKKIIDQIEESSEISISVVQHRIFEQAIRSTWKVPVLIEEIIRYLKNRCARDTNQAPHEFLNRQVVGKKFVKKYNVHSGKRRQVIIARNKDGGVTKKMRYVDDNGSKNLMSRSLGSGNPSIKDVSYYVNKKPLSSKTFISQIKTYFKSNLPQIFQLYPPLTKNKVAKKHGGIFQRFLRRRKSAKGLKPNNLHQSFEKPETKIGAAWEDFIHKVNTYDAPSKSLPNTLFAFPSLSDQRNVHRISSSGKVVNLESDEAEKVEELDEFFNVSDCEESDQVCSYSTIQRKIVPVLPQKRHQTTLDDVIGPLEPETIKMLSKLNLDHLMNNSDENVVPLEKMNFDPVLRSTEKSDVQRDAVHWGQDWSPDDLVKAAKEIKNVNPWRAEPRKPKALTRPTAFRFLTMLNQKKQSSYGIFPYEILRHAAISLRDGPIRNLPKPKLPMANRIATYKRKLVERRQIMLRVQERRQALQETKLKKRKEAGIRQGTNGDPEDEMMKDPSSGSSESNQGLTNGQRRVNLRKRKSKQARNFHRAQASNHAFTAMQIEKHNQVLSYFDQPMSNHPEDVYVAELRSRLIAIWIYFKPYIKTAREFERMLEVYGPAAIYNQLQQYRRHLDYEKGRKDQDNQDGQLSQAMLAQQQLRNQPYLPSMPPQYGYQHNASSGNQQMPNSAAYDSRFQTPYRPQDIYGDDSSSSAVSTPTSADPLMSPFTPTGKRRGRGKRANLGSRVPSDAQLGDISKTRRGRLRKSQGMDSSDYSPSDFQPRGDLPYGPSQPLASSPYQLSSPMFPGQPQPPSYPGIPPNYGMGQVPASRPNTAPTQPSPLTLQSQTSPQKPMPQQMGVKTIHPSHQNYVESSSDDEETDPPPPIKLKVKPLEAPKTSEPTASPSALSKKPSTSERIDESEKEMDTASGKLRLTVKEKGDEEEAEEDGKAERRKERRREERARERERERRIKEKEMAKDKLKAAEAGGKPLSKAKPREGESPLGLPRLKLKRQLNPDLKEATPPPKKSKVKGKSPEPASSVKKVKKSPETEASPSKKAKLGAKPEGDKTAKTSKAVKVEGSKPEETKKSTKRPETGKPKLKAPSEADSPPTDAPSVALKKHKSANAEVAKKASSKKSEAELAKRLAKAADEARLLKEKRRLGILPDTISKSLKERKMPETLIKAQFYPEAGVLIEIPVPAIQEYHELKLKSLEAKNDEALQKRAEDAAKKCVELASRPHKDMLKVLEDLKTVSKSLTSANIRQKNAETLAMSAALAGISKEEAERMAAEKEANLKATELRIQQIKEKRDAKIAAEAAASSAASKKATKGPTDSSTALRNMLNAKSDRSKKSEKARKAEEMEKQKAAKAAEEEAAMQAIIGGASVKLGEALKGFKIPKVQETKEEPPKEEKEASGSGNGGEKERERERKRDRERDREYRDRSTRDREEDYERDRDRGSRHDSSSRRYSNDYSDRRYDADRRFSSEGRYSDERRFDDSYDSREEFSSSRGSFHHHERRGGSSSSGYHSRKPPRSPRSESYDRRGGPFSTSRGGTAPRGLPPPTFRGSRGSGTWKGTPTQDDFYEGLPPKQQQLNREALDEPAYPPVNIPIPPQGFPSSSTRKTLLPNRVAESATRSSSWAPSFFNQPGHMPPSGPGSAGAPPPQHKKSASGYPVNAPLPSYSDKRPVDAPRRPSRPRDSRDSPPEVGLQIDESD